MPLDYGIICRRKMDEERGCPWICRCPWCAEKRREIKEASKEEGKNDGILPNLQGKMEFKGMGSLYGLPPDVQER